jgi:hypothetical protein
VPTKRTKRTPEKVGISAEAIEAWRRADMKALHRACDLLPCEPSPLPAHLTAYGVGPGGPPVGCNAFWRRAWPKAQALQRALLEIAGPPGELGRLE